MVKDMLKHCLEDDPEDQNRNNLSSIRQSFRSFYALLEHNNQVLKKMADLEEKVQGTLIFNQDYISQNVEEITFCVENIIGRMITLGGDKYIPLLDRFKAMSEKLEIIIESIAGMDKDHLTFSFDELNSSFAHTVGSKNAQLGEIKSKLGLPVPEGFAVSAWAYKYFMDYHQLQSRIINYIKTLDIQKHEDLSRVSEDIRNHMNSSPLPADLAQAITRRFQQLKERVPHGGFALRSSALGEDTHFSFAGQYASFLNVQEHEILDRYREILSSLFTEKAIYYLLSHAQMETELAMSVSCIEMIDSRVSGVIYTTDPVHPERGQLLIASIYGLGRYLVDGIITPDVCWVDRQTRTIVKQDISRKEIKLVLDPEGGTREEPVDTDKQSQSSLQPEQIRTLTDIALSIEDHYGGAQDIEWAIDPGGQVYLLQTRPLTVIEEQLEADEEDIYQGKRLLSGGKTVCPGAGGGQIFRARRARDLAKVPDNAVLIVPHPLPGLVRVMTRISALVTEVGSTASHMATIAREYLVPTIVGIENSRILKRGMEVTVDASAGTISEGYNTELINRWQARCKLMESVPVYPILRHVLECISPLNIRTADDLTIENCKTYHDITRFCHQKAMEEMFCSATAVSSPQKGVIKLKTSIPVPLDIIFLDRKITEGRGQTKIAEKDMLSEPMNAFWKGIVTEGWPAPPPQPKSGTFSRFSMGFVKKKKDGFMEKIFAILSTEYMVISMRMGYHFTTVEAMSTQDINKNYIRLLFKGGRSSLNRRTRRIKLIMDVLSPLGFEHHSSDDYMNSLLVYQNREQTRETLYILGRLTMMTKQLDMALSNESITQWYADDIKKKLGIHEEP